MSPLVFQNPLVGSLAGPAILLLGLFAWLSIKRGVSYQRVAALTGLRAATIATLLLLMARPAWESWDRSTTSRTHVALLVDRSASMAVEDRGESRYREALSFLRDELVPAVHRSGLQIRAMLFADEVRGADGEQIAGAAVDGEETDLAGAVLQSITDTEDPPLAVIALTDGAVTRTEYNDRASIALVEDHVPFIGIGFGTETEIRTLALQQMAAPATAVPRESFRVAVQMRATGAGRLPPCELLLLRDGKLVNRKRLPAIEAPRTWQESFQTVEESEGVATYTAQLLPSTEDGIAFPATKKTVHVRIAEEGRLNVLFLQGGLTWDYKFMRLALKQDQTVKLSGLMRTARSSAFMQHVDNDIDLSEGFPTTMEKLAKFHAVVLSNIQPRDLSAEQQELLSDFCGRYGGGVLMIGGASTFNRSWKQSRLEAMLPVRLAASASAGRTSPPFRVRLTNAARQNPVFDIGDADDNHRAWAEVPTFSHFAAVDSVKPGAVLWLVRGGHGGGQTRDVLMAVQRYGTGQSAIICVQNFWRWRLAKDTDVEHYDRFWRQLLRYLGRGDPRAVRITVPDQQLEPKADIRLLLDKQAEPAGAGSEGQRYDVEITDDRKRVVTRQRMRLTDDRPSEFVFRPEHGGVYQVRVLDGGGKEVASRSIELCETARELWHTARDMSVLQQWARLSNGLAVRAEDCEGGASLVNSIRQKQQSQKQVRTTRRPAGINGWTLALLLAFVSGEWLLRKRWGMT